MLRCDIRGNFQKKKKKNPSSRISPNSANLINFEGGELFLRAKEEYVTFLEILSFDGGMELSIFEAGNANGTKKRRKKERVKGPRGN